MKRLNFNQMKSRYAVRKLSCEDIPEILAFSKTNPQFEEICGASMTDESIRKDMTITPPGKNLSDKYYLGFFSDDLLIAVADIIAGYPDDTTSFIGFFMVRGNKSGQGIGSEIITSICDFLKAEGFSTARLAYMKGHHQGEHFWMKNRFIAVKEVRQDECDYVVAERTL